MMANVSEGEMRYFLILIIEYQGPIFEMVVMSREKNGRERCQQYWLTYLDYMHEVLTYMDIRNIGSCMMLFI